MRKLTTATFERPDDLSNEDDPRALYARSYLLTRMVIGGLGVLLPTLLFLLDAFFLRERILVRGSLSAYYHSGARDLFVAALCVTGFFLLTYMAGQKSTWDFWLSSLAGFAVLWVALVPTGRPNIADGAPLCGPAQEDVPSGCTQLQQVFGETQVAAVHFAFAAIFILSLAALCFVFGHREKELGAGTASARFHRLCGAAILAAVAWVAIGGSLDLEVFGITPLYAGEVVSVYAFGLSWLVKAQDLLKAPLKKIFARSKSSS